jgi:DNA-binding XRE family transcriptional regulator
MRRHETGAAAAGPRQPERLRVATFWLPLVQKVTVAGRWTCGEQAGLDFSGLLRRLRDEAGLTQDELAEAAQVSQRAVSDLERGVNATARKDTAVLLAGALGLDGPTRELFVLAASGRVPAAEALAAVGAAGAGGSAASGMLRRDAALAGR